MQSMQNQEILNIIENLKGRRGYEEKKASKLGFSSLLKPPRSCPRRLPRRAWKPEPAQTLKIAPKCAQTLKIQNWDRFWN